MEPKDIQKINSFFAEWKGATAWFNRYTSSHNRFVLALTPLDGSDPIGISFSFCEYIAGPTHWMNCNLSCKEWPSPYDENEMGYEVEDKDAGFVIRGTDTIVIGEGD
jgi:hypothetical protein